jgi:hypothetical protein
MLVNEIFDLARSTTHTTEAQMPNATLVGWANIEQKKIVRKIVTEAQANYFTISRQFDAVAGQTSYPLATNMLNLKVVKVKPTPTAVDYVVSTEIDFAKQEYDINYYATNQSANDPRHQIIGTNMVLVPAFTSDTAGTAGNNQIYQEYEKRQDDLSVGGAESTIALPVDYHYILALSLKPYIYASKGETNEKNDAIAEYKAELEDMIYMLSGRDDTKNNLSTPNDNHLQ